MLITSRENQELVTRKCTELLTHFVTSTLMEFGCVTQFEGKKYSATLTIIKYFYF